MKRKIKFRAWDKTRDEMFCEKNQSGIKNIELNQYGEVDIVELFQFMPDGSFEFKQLNKDDIELMQFTGLLDKNGVEIYEGDVVKIDYTDGWEIGIVEYEKGTFYILDKSLGMNYSRIEIIGNIHENKDLLDDRS